MNIRRTLYSLFLILIGLSMAWVLLTTGEVKLTRSEVFDALFSDIPSGASYIVTEFRGPRIVAAILVGIGLGAAGAVTQSILRNPLASPDIIGVTAGASSGAVLALARNAAGAALPAWVATGSLTVGALLGGMLAGLVVLIGAWKGGLSAQRVILVGLGVNAGCGALVSWLLIQTDQKGLAQSLTWLTGSLNSVNPATLGTSTLCLFLLMIVLLLLTRTLAALRFDTRVVLNLGINVQVMQILLLAIAVATASIVTALAGPVPFIAFIAPYIAQVIFKTEGPPVLGGALVGAVLMLVSDVLATRLLDVDLPVGVVTAITGAPALLWILWRGSKSRVKS